MRKKKTTTRRGDRAGAATAIGLIILGPSALAIDSGPALARLAPQAYEIAPGPMADALSRLADESGAHLVFDAAIARHVVTRGVHGKRTLEEALDELLTGTRLGYRVDPEGRAVMIVLAQNGAMQNDAVGAEALPTIDIGAEEKGQNERGERPGSSIKGSGTGGRFTGYTVDPEAPSIAGKSNVPIVQTPYAVQTITRQTMDDRQAISLKDAVLTSTSGVTVGYQFYDNFLIRGFDTGQVFYRNGLRQSNSSNLETANLQSIEILKGPAAMLYGRVEPGGIVNLVPKRPLPVPYVSTQQQGGNFGSYRGTLDATGPLNDDKSLLYRLNIVYNRTDTFRDFGNKENFLIAPVVTWKPTDRFTLNVEGEVQRTYFVDDLGDLGVPAFGRRPAPIPISRYLGEPALTTKFRNANERALFAYDWTFQLADDWSITNRFSFQNTDYRQRVPGGYFTDESSGDMYRYLWFSSGAATPGSQFYRRTTATNIDINGKVISGPITHNILAGFDYFYSLQKGQGTFNFGAIPTPINIFNPIYLPLNPGFFPLDTFSSTDKQMWRGIYVQDQISFWDDKIHILLSGRHDNAEVRTQAVDVGFGEPTLESLRESVVSNSANSPMAGVLIQPFPWLSIYGNYTRSFGLSQGLTLGTPLPPQVGTQYEGGVKAELLDKRLFVTFAYFDIFKKNIQRPVPGSPLVRAVGEAESRGVEFDLAGRLDGNWSVIFNYSHIDVRFTKDDPGNIGGTTAIGNEVYSTFLVGKRLASIPRNQANLWVKYDALGEFEGLGVAGGVSYVDARPGDDINTYVLPAYARVDGMVSYNFKPTWLWPSAPNLTFQANVRNLLGTTHFEGATDRFNAVPGAPRSFLASIRAEF